MKHVMLDLETMGVDPYACILQIGAVYFDPQAEPGTMIDTIQAFIDIESQPRGVSFTPSTIGWWLMPENAAAWKVYCDNIKVTAEVAMNGFGQWLDSIDADRKKILIWGNGASFDNVLIHQYAALLGMGWFDPDSPDGRPKPGFWPFYNDRCFRTMKNLLTATPSGEDAKTLSLKPPFVGTKHVAVSDSIFQATWLQKICQHYKVQVG